MKSLIKLAGALLLAAGLAAPAAATAIEGYTPDGNFQTVFVSDDGRLFVEIDSMTPQHVIVDGGTITVHNAATDPIPVKVIVQSGDPSFVVQASTADTMVEGCVSLTGSPTIVYPADSARKQGFVYNTSANTVFFAHSNAVSASSPPLAPGGTIQPDTPSSYIGEIWFDGPSGSTICYAYFK